jgi:hypothetical protein
VEKGKSFLKRSPDGDTDTQTHTQLTSNSVFVSDKRVVENVRTC